MRCHRSQARPHRALLLSPRSLQPPQAFPQLSPHGVPRRRQIPRPSSRWPSKLHCSKAIAQSRKPPRRLDPRRFEARTHHAPGLRAESPCRDRPPQSLPQILSRTSPPETSWPIVREIESLSSPCLPRGATAGHSRPFPSAPNPGRQLKPAASRDGALVDCHLARPDARACGRQDRILKPHLSAPIARWHAIAP